MFQALISFFKTTREKIFFIHFFAFLYSRKKTTKSDQKYFDRKQRGREKRISSKLPTQEFKLQKKKNF